MLRFIKTFEKGEFYSKEISKYFPRVRGYASASYDHIKVMKQKSLEEDKKKIFNNRDRIIELIIELLKYQSWD